MGRKILMWVLGYAWLLLLGGLGLVGMAVYTGYSAGHGGGMPDAADLATASGTIVAGREMTVERKRRRGGKTTTHYFELDLKPDGGGELIKLRAAHELGRTKLEPAMDEAVKATYDPNDDNLVFELSGAKGSFITKADMAKLLQAKADREAASFATGGNVATGLVLAALGFLGTRWRRKLRAQAAA